MRNLLFEASPIDPSTGLTVTVRMSSVGVDASGVELDGYRWLPCVVENPVQSVSVFSSGRVQPINIAHGELKFVTDTALSNTAWSSLVWDGALGRVWVGDAGTPFASYTKIFEGALGAHSREGMFITVPLFGGEVALQAVPLLSASYAGTGGAEGNASLKGRFKPIAYGACSNIAPVLVDPAYWIYQYHDGATQDVSAVYEMALSLGAPVATQPTTFAALQALSLQPGQWAKAPAIGMFRLGGQPTGKVTADVQGAKLAGTYVSTLATILPAILQAGGVAPALIDQASFNAFTQAWSIYLTEQALVSDIVSEAMAQVQGYAFANSSGVWKAGTWFSTKTATTVREDRSALPLVIPSTLAFGQAAPPFWRIRVGYDRCWSVHSGGEVSSALSDVQDDVEALDAAAQAAQDAADQAQANATLALNRLENISSDNVLDRSEKAQIVREFQQITAEKAGINSTASGLSITTENTAYNSAYTTLQTYLNGLSPAYTNTSAETTIVRTTWNTNWNAFYSARQALQDKIAQIAATKANWPNIVGTGKPEDGATKNTVTRSPTAPASPTTGDIWIDTSVTPNVTRVRISSAWQVSANYVTNTNEIADGAGLGNTAGWGFVSGKPTEITDGRIAAGLAPNGDIQRVLPGSKLPGSAGNLIVDPLIADAAAWSLISNATIDSTSTELSTFGVVRAFRHLPSNGNLQLSSKMVPAQAGATYNHTVRLIAKAGANATFQHTIRFYDRSGNYLGQAFKNYSTGSPATDIAIDCAVTGVAPANTAFVGASNFMGAWSTGTVWTANYAIRPVSTPALVNIGDTSNMVPDGDFLDAPATWAINKMAVTPNNVAGKGAGANKLVINSASGTESALTANIPLSPGESIRCSIYIETVSGTTGNLLIAPYFYNAAGGPINYGEFILYASGETGFYSSISKAPANTAFVKYQIYSYGGGNRIWHLSEPRMYRATVLNRDAVRENGTTLITDANAITEFGIAAGFIGQRALATLDAVDWSTHVTGANRPADNAGTTLTFYEASSGKYRITGNRITNLSDGSWTGSVYSNESYVGGCVASGDFTNPAVWQMFGLTDGREFTGSTQYVHLDYAFYSNGGNLGWFESGNNSTFGITLTNQRLQITYDGVAVRYYVDGVMVREVATTAGRKFYFGFTSASINHGISNVQFQAGSINAWSAIGGVGRPENGATVGARAGVNLLDSSGATLTDNAIRNTAITLNANGTINGAGGGQVTIGGLGYTGALNATANIVTRSSTAPASPVNGDIWVDTSASPHVTKVRVAGAWQIASNYVTDTAQIADGAGLGDTAVWGYVLDRPTSVATLNPTDGAHLAGIETNADVTSQVTGTSEITINCSHTGAPLDGQLPKSSQFRLMRAGTDVSTSATWSRSIVSGSVTATIGASTGTLSITAITSDAVIRVAAALNGVTRVFDVRVIRSLAAPPSTGGSGGGTGGSAASDTTFSTITSTAMAAITDELSVTVGSSGQVQLTASSSFGSGYIGYFNVYTIWQQWNGSAWVDGPSEIAGYGGYNPNPPAGGSLPPVFDNDPPYEGYFDNSLTITGLTVGSTQKFRLRARGDTSDAIYFHSSIANAQG